MSGPAAVAGASHSRRPGATHAGIAPALCWGSNSVVRAGHPRYRSFEQIPDVRRS